MHPGGGAEPAVLTRAQLTERSRLRATGKKNPGTTMMKFGPAPEQKPTPKRLISKVMRRPDGSKFRIVPNTVYYQGAPFDIGKEVDVCSDETASIDTSDDDFSVDDDAVINQINRRINQKLAEKPRGN